MSPADRVGRRTEKGVTITLTENELVLVSNALNELCHGIRFDDADLKIRTGFSRDEVRALLDRLQAIVPELARTRDGVQPR